MGAGTRSVSGDGAGVTVIGVVLSSSTGVIVLLSSAFGSSRFLQGQYFVLVSSIRSGSARVQGGSWLVVPVTTGNPAAFHWLIS